AVCTKCSSGADDHHLIHKQRGMNSLHSRFFTVGDGCPRYKCRRRLVAPWWSPSIAKFDSASRDLRAYAVLERAPMEADMGLLDVLNGMQNGPRGQREPSTSSGGMSPITMAVLGLLAYKALKHFGGQEGASPAAPGGTARPTSSPTGNSKVGSQPLGSTNVGAPGSVGAPGGGGLGDLLKGAFGGLLAGGPAGHVLRAGF